jgi:5-methylcytosine-specific restriction endonuclease McrA
MGNYIAENRDTLSERHYIRKASAENYWFDFYFNRLESYKERFGVNFCMVIFGSEEINDAYIMPYGQVAGLFTEDLLDATEERLLKELREPEAVYGVEGSIDEASLKKHIRAFNKRYRDAVPRRKRAVSERVARPGAITDYLKQLHHYTCQLCGQKGFIQANGTRYVEAHHILELHKLIPGSYCSDNIVIVCPNCHARLHYATVSFSIINSEEVVVNINGIDFSFSRTLLSSEVETE